MSDLLEEVKIVVDSLQGENITVLDFRKSSPFVDYFLICDVRNARMAIRIIEELEDFAASKGLLVHSVSKNKDSKWFLIDMDSIVCHIFYDGERKKYDLEGLWKDMMI